MINESLLEALEERRSVKKFKSEMVPMDDIEKIVNAGLYAASGMGKQSPIIIEVTDKATRDQLSKMNAKILGRDTDPFYNAPVVLVVLADKSVPTHVYDGSLVLGNMMLASYALGLGSCWIHRAKEEFESEEGRKLLEKLGIEGEWEGIGHLVVGYPDVSGSKAVPRKENRVYKI